MRRNNKMNNRYSEHIMWKIRCNLGLDGNDSSRDNEINQMSPAEALESVCNWEGLINYASTIRSWINDIYGTDI